jgi:hypothetical protein
MYNNWSSFRNYKYVIRSNNSDENDGDNYYIKNNYYY